MNQDELNQIESSQRQHHEVMRHQTEMEATCIGAEYKLFSMLKPKITKDGNEWCCLYGDDIQVGICGFGNTPHEAVIAWNKAWYDQ